MKVARTQGSRAGGRYARREGRRSIGGGDHLKAKLARVGVGCRVRPPAQRNNLSQIEDLKEFSTSVDAVSHPPKRFLRTKSENRQFVCGRTRIHKMSTDRRLDERRFQIEESATANGGKRTTFIETMTPGTSVPPHFHETFSETFDLVSGSMRVYQTDQPDVEILEKSAVSLCIGEPITVQPLLYHKYAVGDEVTTLRCTLTPGNLDFERLLKILDGLARDGELEKLGDDLVMMVISMELADAHLIGPAKVMLDDVYTTRRDEIQTRKEELLRSYDTKEALENLVRKV